MSAKRASINHIAMYVEDLEEAKAFFVKYFGASSNSIYQNPNTGFSSYFISFDGDTRIELMNKPEITQVAHLNRECIGLSHIALSVGSREAVDKITGILKNDGYQVVNGPRNTGDGYYESSIIVFEGNSIEITV